MLDNKGFDLWADGYNKSVYLSDKNNEYPFAGYANVINNIYQTIHGKTPAKVLDIGFGTAILARKLYNEGCSISGIDFSDKMIETAKEKMPKACLIKYDFSNGLPKELEEQKFDFIICTYAIHHLTDDNKILLIYKLLEHLNDDGAILIGDVAFRTSKQLKSCMKKYADVWDSDEYYIAFEELNKHFAEDKISFVQISFCAGIIKIYK